MGIVFEARHRERNTVVALKTLHKLEPMALWRLKTEFRSVADVLHRNLVLLYELCFADGVWFFTMEYVEGENLALRLKRAAEEKHSGGPPTSLSMDTATVNPRSGSAPSAEPTLTSGELELSGGSLSPIRPLRFAAGGAPGPLLEASELRRIFSELAEAILALHEARRLHCDIKPANIMVARDGRTVLLDFGLVNDRSGPRMEALLMGTPSYMAPEQFEGHPATEATDWYALGVMLYEALSGQRPFLPVRSPQDVLRREATSLPPSPGIPEDLRQLCLALLHRNPNERPSGQQVLQELRGRKSPTTGEPTPQRPLGRLFVGRQQQLDMLHEAWRTVRTGTPVTLHVYGRSGMGKTSLVQHFLDGLQCQEQVLVLRGRCYEKESVPYKGFDSLVDSLTQYLCALPSIKLRSLLPREFSDLTRVFPVLRRALPLAQLAPPAEEEPRDKQETRRRAFDALKALLRNLAGHIPLVLHLDDLQWGALDSFTLLHGLISPPGAAPMLLLCSFRSDEPEAATLLAEHRRLKSVLGDGIDIREVEVGPLPPEHTRKLAAALLRRGELDTRVQEVMHESQGSPFFLEELIRYALVSGPHTGVAASAPGAATLANVVLSRVARLPEAARALLELVAVAGRSLPQGIAARAVAHPGDMHRLWSLLRAQCLVRTHGIRDESLVECYHDRIREHLHNNLSPAVLQEHHLRLARSYEAAGLEDPEVLAQHLLGGGERERAGRYLLMAGDKAAEALAFEHAAELYRQSAECLGAAPSLWVKRADALVNAGRCAQAAPVYLQAAEAATGDPAFALRMRAAEQWLVSGHVDEGLTILRPLMAQVDIPYPESPQDALRLLLESATRLRARGIDFEERPEDACPPELLRRIDVAWTAGKGLGSIDVLRGAYFNLVATRLALDAGEPRRVCLGLTWAGVLLELQATPDSIAWGGQLVQAARRIAQQLKSPPLLGYTLALEGIKQMVLVELPQALASGEESLRLLNPCPGVAWEKSQAWSCLASALWQHGALRELAHKCVNWWRQAQANGDHYSLVWMQLYMATLRLAAGDAAAAGQLVAEVQSMLSTERFTPQHMLGVVTACDADMYRGAPEAAWERIHQVWQLAEVSQSMRWHIFRGRALLVRGAAAVALAQRRPSEREALLDSAQRDAEDLAQVGQQCGVGAPMLGHYLLGLASLVRASVASSRGLRELALSELEDAIRQLDTSGSRLFAACARRRKGELLAGTEGQALIEASEAEMRAEGIREPARWTNVYAPGFGPPFS